MEIGRKIYFDKTTGEVIVDTGERKGSVRPTTVEQDIAVYVALSSRNRDTFDVLELAYGQYAQDFRESNSYVVNVITGKLEFSYIPPGETEQPVYETPLTERVSKLEEYLEEHEAALIELTEMIIGGDE